MIRTAFVRAMGKLAVPALVVFGATIQIEGALAVEPPQLKEGLWSIHSRNIDVPSNKKTDSRSMLCRSHASDQHTRDDAKSMKECTTVSESLHANKYTIDSRCTINGSTVESKSTTYFRGSATHTEAHVTYTPALNGITASTLIQDQKYLGKCPAGAEAGDVLLPNGTVQHAGRANGVSRSHP